MDAERLRRTLTEIIAEPSISGTIAENLAADKIYQILSEIPYFLNNPQNLTKIDVENDVYNRYFVSALFCGKRQSKKTVIIAGHLDVVGVDDFGHLKHLAFNVDEYTKRVHEFDLDKDTRADLQSGEWIFGRGTCDMKHGLALGIELLRDLSVRDDFVGNLLFLAVPGEETNSEGMLEAVNQLVELQNQGYEFVALLMPEPYIVNPKDYSTRYVHIGSCGKLNAIFFFAGKQAHVLDPFNGVNSTAMASEVNRLLELNTDFCDKTQNKVSPPPLCLKQRDLTELYSVTLPLYSTACYNFLTMKREPDELLAKLKNLGQRAFENLLVKTKRKARNFEKLADVKLVDPGVKPLTLTYKELYDRVKLSMGKELDIFLKEKIEEWHYLKFDNQTIAFNLMRETYEKYLDKVPMVVIGFAPPYYPHRFTDNSTEHGRKLLEAVDDMIAYAKEKHGEKFEKDDYFTGLSDLSYTGFADSTGTKEMFQNLLGLGSNYIFPVEQLKKLDIPGIILGGFGKDLHKYTERLNMPFTFNILPDLYEHMIYKLLN